MTPQTSTLVLIVGAVILEMIARERNLRPFGIMGRLKAQEHFLNRHLQMPLLRKRESTTNRKTTSLIRLLRPTQQWVEMPTLFPPRWILSTLLAVLVTILICGPVWPGFMSFDSLYAYKQSISGVETAIWVPMHNYFFFISRALGLGVGGLFAFQTFTLFFSAALILSMIIGQLGRFLAAFVAFVVLFFYFPAMLGTTLVIWKDVTMTSMGLLGLALWLIAVRSSSWTAFLLAVLSVSVAISLRHNAFPLFFPFLVLLVLNPLGRGQAKRAPFIASAAVVIGIFGAYASTVWRLPDFRRLPPAANAFVTVQQWDLIGMSACADKNLLPKSFLSVGALTGRDLRAIYDPRHFNLPHPVNELVNLPKWDASAEVSAAWKQALFTNPRCYLSHRRAVFIEQMGLSTRGLFYPTHGGIDQNPYGLRLANPRAAAFMSQYVGRSANRWWGRPFILYLLAGLVVVVVFLTRLPTRVLLVILALGVVGYVGSVFVLMPAADARYIFPSNVFSALILVLGSAGWMSRREPLPGATDKEHLQAENDTGPHEANVLSSSVWRAPGRFALWGARKTAIPSPRTQRWVGGAIVIGVVLFILAQGLYTPPQKIVITRGPMPQYPAWAEDVMGKPIRDIFPKTSACIGNTDLVIEKFNGNPGGSRVIGWAWDSQAAQPVQRIILTDPNQQIVGAGESGFDRPDVVEILPQLTQKTGWQALVSLTSGTVDAYGVTSQAQTICRLGTISW